MPKKRIKIHFQNGLTFESFKKEVFDIEGLPDLYDFEPSANPDFIVFGPYGNDIPLPGNYTRIGYFCENIKPDFSICEWAFGVPREEDVRHPRYKRIQWHGLDPKRLIKNDSVSADDVFASKTKFCNFLYSHRVPYREAFFRQLSEYKHVDAPGRSMNNMPAIDSHFHGDKWEIKKQFLSPYKFTIAFENDIFPGYQTEKLYDAMMAGSLPVYCGDPFIGDIFNTGSFISIWDYMPRPYPRLNAWLTGTGQMDFEDIRPAFLKSPRNRLKRKTKSIIRQVKTHMQFSRADFQPVIKKIIELDNNAELYKQYLVQPWFKDNRVPVSTAHKQTWIEIFNSR